MDGVKDHATEPVVIDKGRHGEIVGVEIGAQHAPVTAQPPAVGQVAPKVGGHQIDLLCHQQGQR